MTYFPTLSAFSSQFKRAPARPSSGRVLPTNWFLLAEGGRAAIEGAATAALWPLLKLAPRGDGHAVVILPGLGTGDMSTRVLREYLGNRGYDAHGWGLGTNFGSRKGVEGGLFALIERLAAESGAKVSIVGWSLGGLYARRLASRHPDLVRSVVTLGSPLRVDSRMSVIREELAVRVPTTSIFSRSDGVVSWRSSLQSPGPLSENIEVITSHLGFGAHPAVLYALADRLAQPEGTWRRFDRLRFGPMIYPDPARIN
jgi:pimeloyl-ACP methyl ester carboxylesterase